MNRRHTATSCSIAPRSSTPLASSQLVPDERRQRESIQGVAEFCLPERRSLSNHDDGRLAGEHECVEPPQLLARRAGQ
jgi:hypothetical protein